MANEKPFDFSIPFDPPADPTIGIDDVGVADDAAIISTFQPSTVLERSVSPFDFGDIPEPDEELKVLKESEPFDFSAQRPPSMFAGSPMVKWLNQNYSGPDKYIVETDADVAAMVDMSDGLGFNDASTTLVEGLAEQFEDQNSGWLWKSLSALTAGEQASARHLVALLHKFDQIPEEDAKDILSQDEVHGSDVVNYFWRAESGGERAQRAMVGFAADVIIDPLTYFGLPIAAGNVAVKIGGRIYKYATRLEKSLGKGLEKAEILLNVGPDVVHAHPEFSGIIEKAGKTAAKVFKEEADKIDINQISNLRQPGIDAIDRASEAALNDLVLELGPDAGREVFIKNFENVFQAKDELLRATDPNKKISFVNDLVEGDKVIQVGARIPFTNFGTYTQMPASSKVIGNGLLKIKNASGKITETIDNALWKSMGVTQPGQRLYLSGKKGIQTLGNYFKLFKTNTADAVFNESRLKFVNKSHHVTTRVQADQATDYILFEGAGDDLTSDIFYAMEMDPYGFTHSAQYEKFVGTDLPYEAALNIAPHAPGQPMTKAQKFRRDVLAKAQLEKENTLNKIYENLLNGNYKLPELAGKTPAEQFLFVKNWIDDKVRKNARLLSEVKRRQPMAKALDIADDLTMTLSKKFNKIPAPGYVKHWVDTNYFYHKKNQAEAISEASKWIEKQLGGRLDPAFKGRALKFSVKDINEMRRQSDDWINIPGLKFMNDNPIEMFHKRQMEMSHNILAHDFLEDISHLVSTKTTEGYVPLFKPDDIKSYLDLNRADSYHPFNFLPKKYRDIIARGHNVYLPHELAIRADWLINPRQYSELGAIGMKALDTYNHFFRNAMLFGPSYIGQNVISNLITYTYAGGTHKGVTETYKLFPLFKHMRKARGGKEKFKSVLTMDDLVRGDLSDVGEQVFSLNNGQMKLTDMEMFNLLADNGILQSGLADEVSWDLLVDNLRATSTKRGTRVLKQGAKTVAEMATLYRTNRFAVRMGDDLPKIAFFIDKLDQGYSVRAARDAVDYWFFNFKDVSPGQRVVRQLLPFSTFAMKTGEQVLTSLGHGKIAYLTLPKKVSEVLEGYYVEPAHMRAALDNMMPEYRRNWDNLHGPILPGGKEVILEIPWAKSTLGMITDATSPTHPIWKVLTTGSVFDEVEYSEVLSGRNLENFWARELEKVLPPPMLHAITALEMSGAADVPVFNFQEKYQVPYVDKNSPKLNQMQFTNSIEFGQWVKKNYGDDWLYNIFFYGNLEGSKETGVAGAKKDAMYANWIRGYFREISFGTARIEAMDRGFMINYGSMRRQRNNLKRYIKKLQSNMGDLTAADMTNDEVYNLREREDKIGKVASEIYNINNKMDALEIYYGFFLKSKQDHPGMFNAIFNLGEDNIDATSAPFLRHRLEYDKDESDFINRIKGLPEEGAQTEPQPEGQFDEQ
jgi:hypothetical protein